MKLTTSTLILCISLVSAGVGGAALAHAAKPTVVRAGNLVLELDGGVTPRRLPKRGLAPIALRVSGGISTVDGSHPPAARTVVVEFDKNGAIDARGLATCRRGELEARTTASAKAACRASIVGGGTTSVRVAFSEQAPFSTTGPLTLFNGGVRRGLTTIYIHAYVDVPAPTALITVVKVKRIRKGRFGTRATARIPTIAGGSGSVTRFEMKIRRSFRRGGARRSYLSARCADNRLSARGDVAFTGGPRVVGTVVRACRVRR